MSSSRTFISLLLAYKILDDDDISGIKKDASNEIGDIKFQSLDRYATTFHNVMDTTNRTVSTIQNICYYSPILIHLLFHNTIIIIYK